MTKFRFTSAALSELAEALAYYESEEPGLGIKFVNEIEENRRSNSALAESMAPGISTITAVPDASLSVWTALSDSRRRDSDYRGHGLAPRPTPMAGLDLVREGDRLLRGLMW